MDVTLQGFVTSAALLACLSALIIGCVSCRRILKRKKKPKKNDVEKGEVGKDGKSVENGISNPLYDNAVDEEEGKKLQDQAEVDTNDVSEPHENGNAPEEAAAATVTEEEEKDQSNHKVVERPITESEQTKSEKEPPDKTDQEAKEPISCQQQQGMEKSSSSVFTESEVSSPADFNRLMKFSESIRSEDVRALTLALDVKTKETITEVENSEPPLNESDEKPDWSRFCDVILIGGWRREVKLFDLLELGLINAETAEEVKNNLQNIENTEESPGIPIALKSFLVGETPVAGILVSESGEKKSIYSSAKEGILRRGTAISLLEAQAATGNIIDPITGRKMSVAEGFQLGLLDKVYETVVSRAERAVTGYKSRVTEETLSLGQAMERGLVIESHGIRLLETQLATGGIIDHRTNVRIPVELAVSRGILSENSAKRLIDACADIPDNEKSDKLKTFFDPNTEENVTYRELMRRSVLDEDTGMRLYPLEKIGRKKYSSFSGRSSLASSRASSKESIPLAVASSP